MHLSAEDIQIIETWILQGALNNECNECDTLNITYTSRIGDIIQQINQQEITDLDRTKEIITSHIDKKQKMHMLKVLSNRNTRYVFIDLKK